ncbi:hypothetical protein TNCV_670261 [Trichonephila clavipes]|nr:hypothetical protein TNCV_670261 [Trichonephila clavipes]
METSTPVPKSVVTVGVTNSFQNTMLTNYSNDIAEDKLNSPTKIQTYFVLEENLLPSLFLQFAGQAVISVANEKVIRICGAND